MLIAPRFDRGERRALPGLNTVFYCLARGVLYALDEADGKVLWAARTGLDTDIMPVRVRGDRSVPRPGPRRVEHRQPVRNHRPRRLATAGRSGISRWPSRVMARRSSSDRMPTSSLDDKDGTVLEIVLATGEIAGRITIGRPLGPVIAARAGTGHLYIPADSRAVYVFDVDRHGPEPEFKKLDPTLLGVMTRDHPPGSLRGVPVFSNPGSERAGPEVPRPRPGRRDSTG